MFQSSSKRLRAWLKWTEDILGDPPEDARPHPHRRELRWERTRRGGSVAARPAHCISPVRPSSGTPGRDRATR
jgi:hypothetical protein